ncbi:UDP-2,3-diacylglucosamine diphosphatase [Ramlibacter sp.]|uniref:UDP-2,3-diacylglucosamine diphosphatase n=1 Tax=Ramlibacter sp. TaxID=1917967 RepID=UPI002C38DF22|nr:UDP-2,3-diacylglucosamine diphosphatase [Ramlibacter sp.]HWI83144.1 UDP-2,3-diacylglucosamine diphosphatase [Ramlibacter sp.]
MPDLPRFAEVEAPATWRTIDFISDLHLQPAEPGTFEAWRRYMGKTPADAVFILGDLFEVWVGDDAAAAPGFAAECAQVLHSTARRAAVYFMPGNRDFLVGRGFLDSCGTTLLADPAVLQFDGRRWLLTHGDALCLADSEYMGFRSQVRNPAWQQEFLAKPLENRQAIARALRQQSQDRKRSGSDYPDVDGSAALAWLDAARAQTLVHGHTHRPADHLLGARGWRAVLSDWDAGAEPPRQQVLRLTSAGLQRIDL